MLKMTRNGEVALATLILFIALILVAATTVGILILSSESVSNKALVTAKDSTQDVGYGFQIVEAYAEDGSSGNDVDYVYWMLKVASGSDDVVINETMLELNLKNSSQTYTYEDSYTYTYNLTYVNSSDCSEVINYSDSASVLNSTLVNIPYSMNCLNFNDTRYFLNANSSVFLNASGTLCPTDVNVTNSSGGNTEYKNLTLENRSISPSITGKFALTKIKDATGTTDGHIVGGDIFQVCFKAPRSVGQDEKVSLGFVPRMGDALRAKFTTPSVIRYQKEYLYP